MNDRARAAQFYRDYILATDSIRTQEIQNSTSEFYAILEVEQLQKEKSDLLLHMQEEKLQTIYTILISLVVVLLVVAMMFCRISKLNQKLRSRKQLWCNRTRN
jgi:C4-dicarboxylate transporter